MIKNLIGSHVSFKAKDYLIGSVKEALSYNSNCFMIYTGPPQNSIRKPIDPNNVKIAHELLKDNNINLEDCIVHAPYIINLASPREEVYKLAVDFLKIEISRVKELGLKYLVLHPGSCLTLPRDEGIKKIIDGLNKVFENDDSEVVVLIETMSGKGSELGISISEVKSIIEGIVKKSKIGICLDTCHLWDSGQDISDPILFLKEFKKHLDINLIKAIHLNDSKNVFGARKDRHENIGYGNIGFEILNKWFHCKEFVGIPKILETPYFLHNDKSLPPYKEEIEMLNKSEFKNFKE